MARQTKRLASFAIPVMVTMAVLSLGAGTAAAQGWEDYFEGIELHGRWTIEYQGRPGQLFGAPGYLANKHVGYYDKDNVTLNQGALSLRLTQVEGNGDEVISWGALIFTQEKYGYGTYEWKMRMSSTALPTDPYGPGSPKSGSVSAGFIYVNNSAEFPSLSS